MPFVATAVARPHASVVVLTVTWQVTAALKALRDGVVGATADGATPLSLHAAASVTSATARASFSRRVMGHLGGGRANLPARRACVTTRTLQSCKVGAGRLAGASVTCYISRRDARPLGMDIHGAGMERTRSSIELGHPLRSELVALAPPYRAHTSVSSL